MLESNASLKFSNGKKTYGCQGIPNRLFCLKLCENKQLFLDFLKEAGLIYSELLCEKCSVPMILTPKNSLNDGFSWICKNKRDKTVCGTTKTIRYDSWFSCSKLKMEEIFLLTYEFVIGTDTSDIEKEYSFSSATLSNWRMLVNKIIFDYMEKTSQKIGGVGKSVEIKMSKWGNKICDRDSEQWVFGGSERDSRKLVFVAVPDRTEETLSDTIKEWIEPGTSVSGCMNTYGSIGQESCEYLTINHGISFTFSKGNINSILSSWRHLKSSLPSYNRSIDIKYYLSMYLFQKSCKENGIDVFVHFLEIIRGIEWKKKQLNQTL
ncbi:DDE_Tnp_IS1595 domain-containing protein [Nephila pilipes]|uniref:DDE_Tnp_IS1595 domain-containing protein n=1 Tax=Nephila pilipes TaxID=299642 RepID=A0A8X6QC02_NEPPI|nr:DDE_Tnp_IS1595 domain-containing protein [Nephila pilipes]